LHCTAQHTEISNYIAFIATASLIFFLLFDAKVIDAQLESKVTMKYLTYDDLIALPSVVVLSFDGSICGITGLYIIITIKLCKEIKHPHSNI
jgi:hypothetical protein